MLYALSDNGEKISACPEAEAFCPECGNGVISKCGQINIWHWAHEAEGDCDSWAECETPWHLNWKKKWPSDCVEVLIKKNGVKHRADILTFQGTVIELQHSPISPDEIYQRQEFYKNMIWIADLRTPWNEDRIEFRNQGDYYTFRWKHPRKHIAYMNQAYFDIGDDKRLFRLSKMYPDGQCGGWGWFLDKDYFIKRRLRNTRDPLRKEPARILDHGQAG